MNRPSTLEHVHLAALSQQEIAAHQASDVVLTQVEILSRTLDEEHGDGYAMDNPSLLGKLTLAAVQAENAASQRALLERLLVELSDIAIFLREG